MAINKRNKQEAIRFMPEEFEYYHRHAIDKGYITFANFVRATLEKHAKEMPDLTKRFK